jgi:hypothetical protein
VNELFRGIYCWQGDQKVRKKIHPIFQKVAQKVSKSKKAQFESPKHLHQTIIETLKYLQQTMF